MNRRFLFSTALATALLGANAPGQLMVTTTADSLAPGTLRTALTQVMPGGSITFNIPTSDLGYAASPERFTISPGSLLPEVSTALIIDGTTQTEFSTHNRPVVEVDGCA